MADPRQIVVLLVDDQAFVGAAVGHLLAAEADITLHCCRDARAAVATANALGPAVILQDLVMPDIDGLTLVRSFRTNPATARTPVIVLSGNDDPATRARALATGADDYLIKLPSKEALIACLRRHVLAGSGPASPGTSDEATATEPPDMNETLDRSILAAFGPADAPTGSFARTLIDQFLREATSHIEGMKDAARRADTRALESTAHNLRGSSMTIGARKLAALCARVERDAARTIQGLAAGVPLVELDREFSRLRDALAAERQAEDRP